MAPAETDRLRFRPYQKADAEAVGAIFADDYAQRFYPNMQNAAAIDGWMAENILRYQTDGFCLWGLIEKATGELIGDCGLTFQNVEGERMLEVGYHIRADRRGNGFALEAARAALEFGLERGQDLVCSIVAPDNAASIAVASKLHSNIRSYINRRGAPRLLYYTSARD